LLYARKIAQGKGLVIPGRGQGQFGGHVGVDRLEPKREAQARSQECLYAGTGGGTD
jgi:hypothetical protein